MISIQDERGDAQIIVIHSSQSCGWTSGSRSQWKSRVPEAAPAAAAAAESMAAVLSGLCCLYH